VASGENRVKEVDEIVLLCLKSQANITLRYLQMLAGIVARGITFNHRLKKMTNWAVRFEQVSFSSVNYL
jgi:hypothetical protein